MPKELKELKVLTQERKEISEHKDLKVSKVIRVDQQELKVPQVLKEY